MEVRFGNYRVSSDKYQYMFQEYEGTTLDKKTGRETERWNTWGYYRTLRGLVRALPDHVIRRSNGNLTRAVGEARVMTERLETALTEAGYQ